MGALGGCGSTAARLSRLVDSHAHAIRQGLTWNHELHWQTVTSLAQGLKRGCDACADTAASRSCGRLFRKRDVE